MSTTRGTVESPAFRAQDPATGVVLRDATPEEAAAYRAANLGARRGFDRPVRVGGVLVDIDAGPGAWHGRAGF